MFALGADGSKEELTPSSISLILGVTQWTPSLSISSSLFSSSFLSAVSLSAI